MRCRHSAGNDGPDKHIVNRADVEVTAIVAEIDFKIHLRAL